MFHSIHCLPEDEEVIESVDVADNVCECPNGTPQTGSSCTQHGANMCKDCNSGWTLSQNKTKCEATGTITTKTTTSTTPTSTTTTST